MDVQGARIRAVYRISFGLTIVVDVCVIAVAIASIPDPLVFGPDGTNINLICAGLLIASTVLLIVSTHPWKVGLRQFNLEAQQTQSRWLSVHPGRFFAIAGLMFATFGVALIVGLSNHVGGNYSYYQSGSHYFETGGDCNICAHWSISRATYLSSVRARGILFSWLWLGGSIALGTIGVTLRRLAIRRQIPAVTNSPVGEC